MLVEGVVDAHDEPVGRTRAEQVCNVEGKCGVAFARVLASELAVHPDRSSVVDGLKFNSDGETSPAFRNVEIATVPSDTAVFGQRRLNLPCVGDDDGMPVT